VLRLRAALPETRVLLLGVFPRGEKPDDPQRAKIAQVNAKIKELDDGKHVTYFDFGGRFIEKDGTISKDVMPDALHLSEKGYEIWAAAMEERLPELLGEKK